MEAYIKVTNRDGRPDTLRWTRQVISITAGCETQVCDPVACYAPFVDTRTFTLPGNETVNVGVWLQNPQLKTASAVVHLKLVNVSNPRDSATAVFLFSPTVSTGEPLPDALVQLNPNPAVDFFTLQTAESVAQVQLYALDGRCVARFAARPDQRYPLTEVVAGQYVVVLIDRLGRSLQTLPLRVEAR